MTTIPTIETERLILREMQSEDAQVLLGYFQDSENSRFWFTPDRTIAEANDRVARVRNDWEKNGFGDWAIIDRAGERCIGFAGIHYISGMTEVNLGYFLARSVWGMGYATEACLAILEFGFHSAGLKKIIGVTHPDNHASIRVLQKIGMCFWKEITRGGLPRVVYMASAKPPDNAFQSMRTG